MSLGIGVDTGGTYTDAVIYDFSKQMVLAKGKALTTYEDLSVGIGNALDSLPESLLQQAEIVALSTTLATNASVEHKGSRAKLILMGASNKILEWVDAKTTYGLNTEEIICLDSSSSLDGTQVADMDWDAFVGQERHWLSDAHALSIAEIYASRNGAKCEKNAKEKLSQHFGIPIILASELAKGLNVLERGATALLNARLLPVIDDFMKAMETALKARNMDTPTMIVRSDGSLMVDQLAYSRPAETILSGPAASVIGGRKLANCANCLIVDIGGTTTDLSLIHDHAPVMTDGIRIGNWRTQIKGVYCETIGLGGDSRIYIKDNQLELSHRKVQPICMAASRWPEIKTSLKILRDKKDTVQMPLYEFIYLAKEPEDPSQYYVYEQALIEALRDGPVMLGGKKIDIYNLRSERLENEGVIMRCGLTPTDIMHIKGDYSTYDQEASILAAEILLDSLPQYDDRSSGLTSLCDDVYEMVCRKLYENIVRLLLRQQYPERLAKGIDEQVNFLITQNWQAHKTGKRDPFFEFNFHTDATLIGIGAPTHVFLPKVAEVLGTKCIIPEHAEVANAIGAIVADIAAEASIEVIPNNMFDDLSGYTVYTDEGNASFPNIEDALEHAQQIASKTAINEAKKHGAIGELCVEFRIKPKKTRAANGIAVDLGTIVWARASARMVD